MMSASVSLLPDICFIFFDREMELCVYANVQLLEAPCWTKGS